MFYIHVVTVIDGDTASSSLLAPTLHNILLYTELAFPKETQVKLLDELFTTITLVIVGIFSGLFVGKTYPRQR